MNAHGNNCIKIVNLATWRAFRATLKFSFDCSIKEGNGMVKVGLLVRLKAKPGKEDDVNNFLKQGLALANEEETTPVWFALRLDSSTFGIFDAFSDEASRSAHLSGPIAAALMANAPDLLASPPEIERVDVLGAKLPT
jgi:quinol monooxygenase YgiN